MKALMVKLRQAVVLYSSIIYLFLYLNLSNAPSRQSHMESVSSVPILAGYCGKNFCYILDHRDLLQESGGLILRVHNSNKSCCCCFLIAVASCMYIPLVKEIKEAYRHLIRMRTIKTVPNSLCEPPFND
jgi:hypothetical protein